MINVYAIIEKKISEQVQDDLPHTRGGVSEELANGKQTID